MVGYSPWHGKELDTTEQLHFHFHFQCSQKGFPAGSDGKGSVFSAGDSSSTPGSGRFPWRWAFQPTPVFLPGDFYGQRSLWGYSPWGHKESDMTEWLSTHAGFTECSLLYTGGGGLVTKSRLTLVTLWTVAHQAPLSMGFPRQAYLSRLPIPSPWHLPNPGVKPGSPTLADNLLNCRLILYWLRIPGKALFDTKWM